MLTHYLADALCTVIFLPGVPALPPDALRVYALVSIVFAVDLTVMLQFANLSPKLFDRFLKFF